MADLGVARPSNVELPDLGVGPRARRLLVWIHLLRRRSKETEGVPAGLSNDISPIARSGPARKSRGASVAPAFERRSVGPERGREDLVLY